MQLVDRLGAASARCRHRGARRHPGHGAAVSARAVLRHARHAARGRCARRPRIRAETDTHIDSAAEWWRRGGLDLSGHHLHRAGSLGLPEDSLRSFPEHSVWGWPHARHAAGLRAERSENWEKSFGTGEIHIGVSVFSDSEQAWRDAMHTAQQQYQGFAGVTG